MKAIENLSDRHVMAEARNLAGKTKRISAKLIAYLAEVDRRGLFLKRSHSSMWSYCVDELHMSEEVAAKRIRVVRIVRAFPAALHELAQERIHCRGLLLLSRHMTEENHRDLLAAAAGKSCSQIRRMLEARFPDKNIDGGREASEKAAGSRGADSLGLPRARRAEAAGGNETAGGPRAAKVVPLSRASYRIELIADQEFHDALEEVAGLLSHRVPSGDLLAVLKVAVDEMKRKLLKERFGIGGKPAKSKRQKGRTSKRSRHIPADIRRRVYERDGGQCTYVSPQGVRCRSRRFIQFEHMKPWAKGGKHTEDNLRLLCWAHNQLRAEEEFGREHVSRKKIKKVS